MHFANTSRNLLLGVALVFVSGCSTFHTQPYVAYGDARHPKSDTAVISTSGLNGSAPGQIVAVDGVKTSVCSHQNRYFSVA